MLLVAATLTLLIGLLPTHRVEDANSDESMNTKSYAWVEGVSIYFAVALIALFASASDYMREKQLLKLHDEIKNEEVSVIRGQYGLSQSVKVVEVVVGDIVIVEAGSRVPADCILIDGMDITVDEASYYEGRETIVRKNLSTGENHKENPDPFLLSGSLVLTGTGRAVVCAVGKNTHLAQSQGEEEVPKEE